MKIIKILPVIIFCLLSYFLYWKISNIEETKELSSAMLNQNFPKLNLEVIEGKLPFSKLVGEQEFIVNYFASWCAPCRIEAPILEELNKIIPVVGVAYKDKFMDTKKFLNDFGNPYKKIGIDNDGKVAIEWGVYGVPETFLINKKGEIIYRHAGPLLYNIFKFEVLPLVQEN